MSRVITFSRFFPASHPKTGEPTYFVEKIWLSLVDCGFISMSKVVELSKTTGIGDMDIYTLRKSNLSPKGHTIRTGNRWKVGDKFSPRVWSGKPYKSKQIQFAPDIEIKKIWEFSTGGELFYLNGKQFDVTSSDAPTNDGLSTDDFLSWFDTHPKNKGEEFSGEIISWNELICYPKHF